VSAALKAYPDYRDSGVDWLGRVPAHWEVVRSKRVFREVDDRATDGTEPHLAMSQKFGLVPSADLATKHLRSASYAGAKRCLPGDIVLNRLKAHLGVFARANHRGVVSPDYTVLRSDGDVEPRYFEYTYRSTAFRGELRKSVKGIVEGFWRLYSADLGRLMVPAPPPEEQRRIADFLDAYTAQVHRLVAAKRRTISALIERKQAIIEGLLGASVGKTSATVRHAEVGDVQEHWHVARLKDWCDVNAHTLPESTPGDYTFDYFDISAVGMGVLTGEPQAMTFDAAPSRARRRLAPNDILISTVRTYLKAIYFFQGWPRDAIASTGFAVLTPKAGVLPELLAYALMTPRFINVVISRSVGVAYPAIAETRLSALHLALPPDESEQHLILNAIKADTKVVDEAIAKERSQIDLILEFRDTLVAAVVTGQLDVRGAEVATIDAPDLSVLPSDEEDMEDALEQVD
jgi:type I restriction enzyme S subunit